MLRSLVGSEMCIRDRVVAGESNYLVSFTAPDVGLTPVRFCVMAEQDQHCLLYTSDAADDLLCVDLGGRRIIKKKRTTTNEMTSIHNI